MHALRTCVIVTWLVVAVIGQPAGIARAAEAVDVALVLAADVSRSINDEEFGLQRQGYAAALTSLMIQLFLGSWRSTVIIATSIPLSDLLRMFTSTTSTR
jgi:multidrug efflux pump subunit AcrB